MLSKKPVQVLKKKLYPDLIMYKIAWSNDPAYSRNAGDRVGL